MSEQPQVIIMPLRNPPRSELKKQLRKIMIALVDMSTAHELCQHYITVLDGYKTSGEERIPYYPWEAFLSSIIMAHSRPFTHNDGFGVLPAKFSAFPTVELKATHDFILTHRNLKFAHSDLRGREVIIVPPDCLKAKLPIGASEKPRQVAAMIRDEKIAPIRVAEFYSITLHVKEQLEKEHQSLLTTLYGGLMDRLPAKEFPLVIDDDL